MPNSEVGSRWRRWDLHVHTPESLVQWYPGSGEDAWETYIADLEALPADVKVLGINDYIFIDGYRRLRTAKLQQNRLKNIDLLLPVVELRLDKFGGTQGALSRVNFHVIFSDEVDPDLIEAQFLNALPARAHKLVAETHPAAADWKALPTRASLEDLGKRVIASVPAEKQKQFGPPLLEGFNNLNFRRDDVLDVLDSPYFRGKYLTAVGKTEWADIKWNDHTVADKKTIINGADVSFTSAETPEAFRKSQASLEKEGVKARLLDCSDAHYPSGSTQKDRIGKCFTWISADTTFAGLRHAILEYRTRVFVGVLPPKLAQVQAAPMNFMQSVSVKKVPASTLVEKWFDYDLPLNPGLVAIIGNKGSGKSALADTIGHLSFSRRSAEFSFLNEERFRHKRKHKAEHFAGRLYWISGEQSQRLLSDAADPTQPERTRYIPQKFLERLCNGALDSSAEEFERVLKDVIYSHVPIEKKLGRGDMNDLIQFLSAETERSRAGLRDDLHRINEQIVTLENEFRPEHRRVLEGELAAKQQELLVHDSTKPAPVAPPSASEGTEAEKWSIQLEELRARCSGYGSALAEADSRIRTAERKNALLRRGAQKAAALDQTYREFVKSWNADLVDTGLRAEDVVKLSIDGGQIKTAQEAVEKDRRVAAAALDESVDGSPAQLMKAAKELIANIEHQLGEPARRHRAYLDALAQWGRRRKEIIGTLEEPGSIENLKGRLARLGKLPELIADAYKARIDKALQIYASIAAERELYADLYASVQKFISDHPLAPRIRLQFTAGVSEAGFVDEFFEFVSKTAAGSFRTDAGTGVAKALLAKYDFDAKDEVGAFLADIVKHLTQDQRPGTGQALDIEEQLRRGRSKVGLLDYIFGLEYLAPRYSLTMDGKTLPELSPGERGSLLLIFFLLVDKSPVPLIIDQPEENLDNQTVVELLVPAIAEARQHRQVVIVTHNPNLAVVCDADQVIYAELVRAPEVEIRYESGAIEHPQLNKRLLDVLEGTHPAFSNRDSKYKLSAIAAAGS